MSDLQQSVGGFAVYEKHEDGVDLYPEFFARRELAEACIDRQLKADNNLLREDFFIREERRLMTGFAFEARA